MKKKKRNYYNLFIHFIKIFSVLGLLCMVPAFLAEINILPYESQGFYMILVIINGLMMILCIFLADKFSSKITIELDGPTKPYIYSIKKVNIESVIQHKLMTEKNFGINTTDFDKNLYYYQKFKFYCTPPHEFNAFIVYSFEEYDKEVVKYIMEQRRKIVKMYRKKNNFLQIGFIIQLKSRNELLNQDMRERTPQYLSNYCMIAFYIEEEEKLYVPHADWADVSHGTIKRKLLKLLQEYRIK